MLSNFLFFDLIGFNTYSCSLFSNKFNKFEILNAQVEKAEIWFSFYNLFILYTGRDILYFYFRNYLNNF